MEFTDVLARRRMVRRFDPRRPLELPQVDRLLAAAARAPSAGNSQPWHFVVLSGPDETARLWDVTLPPQRRDGFAWPGLLDAPLLVLPVADPDLTLGRYAESDKAGSGLGADPDAWAVPYWLTDTAFATMLLLAAAVDEGLGACFFGLFRHEREVMAALGVPERCRPLGVVAIGHPLEDRPGRSADRGRRPFDEVVHRGGW
ncbi:MAG: nitroreductase family protein [Acidimicrobiia bacterium]|nr:nitroreductase family protein [Acidimicrobiia bacterium]